MFLKILNQYVPRYLVAYQYIWQICARDILQIYSNVNSENFMKSDLIKPYRSSFIGGGGGIRGAEWP